MRGPLILLIANLVLLASRRELPHEPAPQPTQLGAPRYLAMPDALHVPPLALDLLGGDLAVGLVIRPPADFPDSRPWPYGMVIAPPPTGDRMPCFGAGHLPGWSQPFGDALRGGLAPTH